MFHELRLNVIARIHNDYTGSFGIPRQSGLSPSAVGIIVFEPDYRDENALRGIEDYSHLWLIWGFSNNEQGKWSATVRPPRLGGNKRMGVFATRSPYRPNPLGLSSVTLMGVEKRVGLGKVLLVGGADIMDGTPIYDIKPYLSFTDSHPDAKNGFAEAGLKHKLSVAFAGEAEALPDNIRVGLLEAIAEDPRPAYKADEAGVYALSYAGYTVRFHVREDTAYVLSCCENADD